MMIESHSAISAFGRRLFGAFIRTVRLLLVPVALCIGIAAEAAAAPDPIAVSFGSTAVHATGITPGGEAVIFGSSTGTYGRLPRLRRHAEVVVDSDGDGRVTLAVSDVPTTSVWAVVDFKSGRFMVAAPSGFELRRMELPEHGWRRETAHIDFRRDYLEVLVVRPGEGAWTLRISEGGSNDDDGRLNSVLRTKLTRMERLHGRDDKPRPAVVLPKDVLIVIDPKALDYFATEAQ